MWRYVIPNAFSSANLISGLFSMAFALDGQYTYAALAVLLGMVFDALDGNMARLFKAGSEFGKQMDSLCDLVTFGVAPAFLVYMQLQEPRLSIIAALPLLAFPVCGALRLARFNVSPPLEGGGFTGIPITAAGGILAVCSLSLNWFGRVGILLFTAFLSLLMVSTIRYPDLKSVGFLKNPIGVVLALAAVALFVWFFREWLFIPLVGYAFTGLILMIFPKKP